MDSPYIRNKHRKKNNESNSSKTHTHTTNEINKSIKRTKKNEKNDLKCGPILENNHHDDNIKFISIARKKVDNV